MKIKILLLLVVCAASAKAQQYPFGYWLNPLDSGYVATFTTKEPMTDKYCDILMVIVDNNKDTTTMVRTREILHFSNEDPLYTGNLYIANLFDLDAMKNLGYTISLMTKINSTGQFYYSCVTTQNFSRNAKKFKKRLAKQKIN